ncbi:hypothetical protein ACFQ51_56275 [Streptomyces kaempferi]
MPGQRRHRESVTRSPAVVLAAGRVRRVRRHLDYRLADLLARLHYSPAPTAPAPPPGKPPDRHARTIKTWLA